MIIARARRSQEEEEEWKRLQKNARRTREHPSDPHGYTSGRRDGGDKPNEPMFKFKYSCLNCICRLSLFKQAFTSKYKKETKQKRTS